VTRAIAGSGFLGLGSTFRSLTTSPARTAINEAYRIARRRLEAGGAPASASHPVDDQPGPADFVLPADIDPMAIEAKLHSDRRSPSDRPKDALHALQRRAGGRVVVPGRHILRLGDRRFDRGKRFIQRVIRDIRARRVLTRSIRRRGRLRGVTTLQEPHLMPPASTSFRHAR
jgi:hypothetical protein